jgi:orotidine-5'-phosphate decarboxylase
MRMKPELIVALDVPSAEEIPGIVGKLPPELGYYKVGLEIYTAEGPAALVYLKEHGKHVFLDLKLHDIPRTVARAVTAAAQLGVSILTVHAGGGREMLKAAAQAARDAGPRAPRLVAVTTLTSLAENDLRELGVTRPL